VMALSLSGVVTFGRRFAGAGQALAGRAGYAGSFFTGALATVAATPCTAPFMGAAIGYALAQPWTTALLVFEALGLGLALPYLLLASMPGWRRMLPKPGLWMERLKEVLAFPLYASAAWLVWVVSRQAGSRGVGTALAGMVMLGLGAWLYQAARDVPHSVWRRVTTPAVAALIVGVVALAWISRVDAPAQPGSSPRLDGWEPYTAERLAELRAEGKPVFVNFTAAWCLTCLVNERVALRSPAVTDAFVRRGVATLKADWTTRDPSITKVLGAYGRSGVPLYVLYAPRAAEATVLPQILSDGIVIDAVGSP